MRKRLILYVCLALLGVAVLIGVILLGYSVDWTGFQAYTDPKGDYHPAKTLWDWIQLSFPALMTAVVTVFVAFAVWWLNKKRAETEQALADARMREDRLLAYLGAMKELLLDYDLRSSEVRGVARTLTLTVLKALDRGRKGQLLLFLIESELLRKGSAIALLKGADLSEVNLGVVNLSQTDLSQANLNQAHLSGANLIEANLSGASLIAAGLSVANLSKADLSKADLSQAFLSGANLSEANLSGANLSGAELRIANLSQANLRKADLSGSNLIRADLYKADLREAMLYKANLHVADLRDAKLYEADLRVSDLSQANLRKADLQGASLVEASLHEARYDDETIWPNGFDPIAKGAVKVDQERPDESSIDESARGLAAR